MSALSVLRQGKTAVITSISGGKGLAEKLEAMGIRPGVAVKKVSSMRNGGPVVMVCGRTQVALGRGMASRIMVQEVEDEQQSCKKPA